MFNIKALVLLQTLLGTSVVRAHGDHGHGTEEVDADAPYAQRHVRAWITMVN